MFAVARVFSPSVSFTLVVEKVRFCLSLLFWIAVLCCILLGMTLFVAQVVGLFSERPLLPDLRAIAAAFALTLATPVLAGAAYCIQPKGVWRKFLK